MCVCVCVYKWPCANGCDHSLDKWDNAIMCQCMQCGCVCVCTCMHVCPAACFVYACLHIVHVHTYTSVYMLHGMILLTGTISVQ